MGQICSSCTEKKIKIEDQNRNQEIAARKKKEEKKADKIYQVDAEKKIITGPTAKKIADVYKFANPPIQDDEADNTEIRRAKHIKIQDDVLIKIFKNLNDSDMKNALTTVDALQKLENPNILRIKEAYQEENKLYVVTENMKGDILFAYILKTNFTPEEQIAFWVKDILQAVNYLHNLDIVHREIDPSNLMFATEDNQGLKLFNCANVRYVDPKEKMQKKSANAIYSPPEVYQTGQYDKKCDIWGVGVIMFVLCAQISPFYMGSTEKTINALKKATDDELEEQMQDEEWSRISKEAKEFVKQLLKIDPAERISAEEALKNKWLVKQTSNALNKEHLAAQFANMKQTKPKNQFQQLINNFMVQKMSSQKDRLKIEAQFKELDANGDGHLTKEELLNGLKKIIGEAEARAEVDDIFTRVDKDGSGSIQYNEYMEASLSVKEMSTKDNLRAVFNTFTSNEQGISVEDLKGFFSGTEFYKDDNYFLELIKPFDTDKSGFLDFDEFIKMMETQCQQEI